MNNFDTLVLMSGGIESVVLAYYLREKMNKNIMAINFDMGTPPTDQQVHYSKKIMYSMGAPCEIVNMPGITRMTAGFVDPNVIIFDEGDVHCDDEAFIPIIITSAIYFAQIAHIPELSVGLTKEQLRNDTPNFINEIGQVIRKYEPGHTNVTVNAPFADKTKSEVIQLGLSLGVNFDNTWSCFNGGSVHCGTCPSCIERKNAFNSAAMKDTTNYS